jgi:hypothetical protein
MRKSDRKLRVQELESRLALDSSGLSAAAQNVFQFASQEYQQVSQILTSAVQSTSQEAAALVNLVHTDLAQLAQNIGNDIRGGNQTQLSQNTLSVQNLERDAASVTQIATNAAAQIFRDSTNFVNQVVSDASQTVRNILAELPQLTLARAQGNTTLASQLNSVVSTAEQGVQQIVQRDLGQLSSALQSDVSQTLASLNTELQQILKDAGLGGTSTTLPPPTSQASIASINPTSADQFVSAAYQDILGRLPDAAGLANITQLLNNGVSQSTIASILAHSDEALANIVTPIYQKYLGRLPDAAGLQFWISQLHGGMTDSQMTANILGSNEFFQSTGGTAANWITALYADLLGRTVDSNGLAFWLQKFYPGDPTHPSDPTRTQIALSIAASAEAEAQVIVNDYLTILGRVPSGQEVSTWLNLVASGITNEDVVAAFVGSSEFASHL